MERKGRTKKVYIDKNLVGGEKKFFIDSLMRCLQATQVRGNVGDLKTKLTEKGAE